jgi:hypothetical protein
LTEISDKIANKCEAVIQKMMEFQISPWCLQHG